MWDAGCGDDRADPSRAFRSAEADQGDLRELKVSRNMVRKVLRSGATEFEYERDGQPQPKLGPWREELERLLAANDGTAGAGAADADAAVRGAARARLRGRL